MTYSAGAVTLDSFKLEVLQGLREHPKRISPKYFYDERGSKLFEKICRVPEYYPTRVEAGILKDSAAAIAAKISSGCALFEFGSGASVKTRFLLDQLKDVIAYLPIDISGEFLESSAERLRLLYPHLQILPICADFTKPLRIEAKALSANPRRVGFLPGSTLGNFTPAEAIRFLRSTAQFLGYGGQFLVGIDLVKDQAVLEAAYNDSERVTAEFNLNVLLRLKNELGAEIDLEAFEHYAFFNRDESRIEMHLISRKNQVIEIEGERISLLMGEGIHTENSYKYTPAKFKGLVSTGGFDVLEMWTDERGYFGVFLLAVRDRLQAVA
jgi:dimethylhistidine N-methyltransferase